MDNHIITSVEAKHFPKISYETLCDLNYGPNYRYSGIIQPDGRFLKIEYNGDRRKVKQLLAPAGTDNKPIAIYSFEYHNDHTTVIDAAGNKTIYYFSPQYYLTHVDRYIKNNKYRSENFVWGTEKHAGYPIERSVSDNKGNVLASRKMYYDERGNLVREELVGKGLEGKRTVSYTYSNDGMNLLLKETDCYGVEHHYQYKPGTNLVVAKKDVAGGKSFHREFFEYDKNTLLTKKIVDDGSGNGIDDLRDITERLVTVIKPELDPKTAGFNLPKEVCEYYLDINTKKLQLLKITKNFYAHGDLLVRQDVHDSQGNYRYSLHSKYNDSRQLIEQKDALNNIVKYGYDSNFNKNYEENVQTGKKTYYRYDYSNRLIAQEEHHPDKRVFITRYTYDTRGNCTSVTDHFGSTTTYTYDELNRQTSRTDPLGNKYYWSYDVLDNIASTKNEKGNVTTYEYNIDGNITKLQHPDGSIERFLFDIGGRMIRKWHKSGSYTAYTYDPQGRITLEQDYSSQGQLLRSKKNVYKGKHLILEVDHNGVETHYTYDGAGRQISKTVCGERTTYQYDSLGRPWKTFQWLNNTDYIVQIQESDYLDQVIEERIENQHSELFKRQTYSYDSHGNKTVERSYTSPKTYSETRTEYNSYNKPVLKVDQLGNKTTTTYDYNHRNLGGKIVLKTITTDPLQQKTIDIYDVLGRLVSTEKLDPQNRRIALHECCYDSVGNKTHQINHQISNFTSLGTFVVAWKYDSMNRVSERTEQSSKTITYLYNKSGVLEVLTRPDGVKLHHSYDHLNRLWKLTSSDKTISYTYSYDNNDNVTSITNGQWTNTRRYDHQNRLTYEALGNGLAVFYSYDCLGRLKKLVLPDSSAIDYTYDGVNLVSVNRGAYAHHYLQTDLEGKTLASKLIGNCGNMTFAWDQRSRNIGITSKFFEQHLDKFDNVGNLLHLTWRDTSGTTEASFQYDSLYQLIKEQGMMNHTYAADSLNGRLAKNKDKYTLNLLLQVASEGQSNYTYDKNGNRLTKQSPSGNISYAYDALDRLVAAQQNGVWRAEYSYDSFGRRLSKKYYEWVSGKWNPKNTEKYFYQQEREIGATDSSGKIIQLRVLGHSKGADIGAAIALELDGKVYAPYHDHRGNVCGLLDFQGVVIESYRYSAFGEIKSMTLGQVNNPWRFVSKRFDEETGLFLFGKRYYDPSLGSWLTPDPLGFADGPNLYAYVHNNPLILFDPYGLFAMGDSFFGEFRDDSMRSLRSFRAFVWDFSHGFCYGFNHPILATKDINSSYNSIKWNSLGLIEPENFGIFRQTREPYSLVNDFGKRIGTAVSILSWISVRKSVATAAAAKTTSMLSKLSLRAGLKETPQLATAHGPKIAARSIATEGEVVSNLVTKSGVETAIPKSYLQKVHAINKNKIIDDMKSFGLKLKGRSPCDKFMEFIDKQGKVRVKLHPADKITKYNHMHVYDEMGYSLDKNLNIVNERSLDAHILIGE